MILWTCCYLPSRCKKQGMCATDSFLVDSAEKKVEELRQNLLCLREEAEMEKRRRKEKMRILEEQAISEENKKSQAKLYLQARLCYQKITI